MKTMPLSSLPVQKNDLLWKVPSNSASGYRSAAATVTASGCAQDHGSS